MVVSVVTSVFCLTISECAPGGPVSAGRMSPDLIVFIYLLLLSSVLHLYPFISSILLSSPFLIMSSGVPAPGGGRAGGAVPRVISQHYTPGCKHSLHHCGGASFPPHPRPTASSCYCRTAVHWCVCVCYEYESK